MNFRAWIHGLVAGAIGAGATAGAAALAVPKDFNLSHDGLIDFAKLIFIPAAFSVFTYLKQSPLPAESTTVTAIVTKTVSSTPE